MKQERFWILFSKKLSGEISPEEMRELETSVREHTEWHIAAQHLEAFWEQQPSTDQSETEDAYLLHLQRMHDSNNSLQNFSEEGEVPFYKKSNRIKWYWAAASLLVLIAGALFFTNGLKKNNSRKDIARQVSEISTRLGSKSKVELPDGSMVWLNAGSKLTYNKEFGKELREVTLEGEGYFDVVKMKEKPFVIYTSSINIRVLGTVFNVKAYPEDKQTEASLIKGSIEVTIKNRPSDKIILSPSEKLVVQNGVVIKEEAAKKTEHLQVNPAPLVLVNKLRYSPVDSTLAETAWVDNRLVFRDETFESLAVRLERWYDVSITIDDQLIKQARLNGTFQSESVTQALDALTEMLPFRYEKKGTSITIKR